MATEAARSCGYKGVLFAPDGDWVVDYHGDTKKEVIEQLANRGSKWYFYPLEGVILNKGGLAKSSQRLVDAAPPIELLKGKALKTVKRYLERNEVELF